ncbi:MAG: hypothetical protein ACI8P3_001109 [Saprospiraceae bacterium]|jgi:hypothetical protein
MYLKIPIRNSFHYRYINSIKKTESLQLFETAFA